MTFDLEAARALHDRWESGATYCGTCHDSMGNLELWPCATATALGATGRSEWLDAPKPGFPGWSLEVEFKDVDPAVMAALTGDPAAENLRREAMAAIAKSRIAGRGVLLDPETPKHCGNKHFGRACIREAQHDGAHLNDHAFTWRDPEKPETPKLCRSRSQIGYRDCSLPEGHSGRHEAKDGHLWRAPGPIDMTTLVETPRCGSVDSRGIRCQYARGHALNHKGPDPLGGMAEWPNLCGEKSPDGTRTCVLKNGHEAPEHQAGDASLRWAVRPCRKPMMHGAGCLLAEYHEGDCWYSSVPELARCAEKRGYLTCTLPDGHPGAQTHKHRTVKGESWEGSCRNVAQHGGHTCNRAKEHAGNHVPEVSSLSSGQWWPKEQCDGHGANTRTRCLLGKGHKGRCILHGTSSTVQRCNIGGGATAARCALAKGHGAGNVDSRGVSVAPMHRDAEGNNWRTW